MINKLMKYITEYNIINPQDHIIAGVSGGADSVCLFLVLCELRKKIAFDLEVIHVEHGIRGKDSRADADFTSSLCEKYGISCKVVNVDVPSYASENGLGLEEAARLLRYEIFAQRAKEIGGKVALAHHKEDNVETILFQMVRGSGLHGLSGMKAIRKDLDGVIYIRPLLGLTRDEVEKYLESVNQDYRTDVSNFDTKYDRNKIRHSVIPVLKEINDQAVLHIDSTAQKLAVIEDYITLQVKAAVEEVLCVKDGIGYIDICKMEGLHPAIKSECILEILGILAGKKKDIGAIHIEQLLGLSNMQSGKKINLPYGLIACKEYDKIVITKANQGESCNTEYYVLEKELEDCYNSGKSLQIELKNPEETIEIEAFDFDGDFNKIPQKAYTKWVDYDKIKDGFCIRKRAEGDFFVNDSKGHHKKLKGFFTDLKIPLSDRDNIWLMAKGQEIIIIFGLRINEAYKVTADTKRVLSVTHIGRENDGYFKEL